MKTYVILDSDNDVIRKLKTESNTAQSLYERRGQEDMIDVTIQATDFLIKLCEIDNYRNYINFIAKRMELFANTNLLAPLTLKEGEFIYIKPGLSMNRRFTSIKQNIIGIYNEDAYKIRVVEIYNPAEDIICILPNNYESMTELNNKPNRVYVSTGGLITNICFDIAYVKELNIKVGSWYPPAPIKLPCCRYFNEDKYINIVKLNSKEFIKLKDLYDINLDYNKDDNLRKFNVVNNISKNELYR